MYPQYPSSPVAPPVKPKTRWIPVTVVVAVLAIGAAVGVWLWQGGGGTGSAAQDGLPANQDLPELPFPDPDSFGYGDGPDAMCAALDEVMSARGYLHVSGKENGGGQYCRFITPGLSLLTDGSNNLHMDIGVWRNNAEERYAGLLESALETSQQQRKNPSYTVSKVERFPVGDAGFVFHREGDRADTEVYIRAGDDLLLFSVWGVTVVSTAGELPETKALTEEIVYREITDVLRSLTGTGEPGPAQITAPALAENAALAGLAGLAFPRGYTVEDACAKVAPLAGTLGVKQKSSTDCVFEPVTDDWRDYVEGFVTRDIVIRVKDYPKTGNIVAAEELARDLQGLLKRSECGPLYRLPFADTGYAVYCERGVEAGFVVDGTTYVHVNTSGSVVVGGGDLVGLSEDAATGDMIAVLTAMGG